MSPPATNSRERSQKPAIGNAPQCPAWPPDVPHNDLRLIRPAIHLETRPVLERCVGPHAAVFNSRQQLTLLNCNAANTFFVGTSNDAAKRPPEFAQAERFDVVFFVELPGCDLVLALNGSKIPRDPIK